MTEERVVVTSPEVRTLAAEWVRQLETLAADMYAFIAERVPEAKADEEIAGLTLASCSSNIETALSMIRHGIPASATEAPVAALEHARQMAVRGASIDATLRFYRLGHAYFWERLSTALVEAVDDPARLVAVLEEISAFVFAYIDAVSSRVSEELIAERERRQRRVAAARADLVRAVMAGEHVDLAAAERTLGHQLSAPQIAFVCWTAGEPAALERTATAIAGALGARRPLLLEQGPQALAAWVVAPAAADPAALAAAAVAAAPEVHVAVGGVGRGIEGFRSSRDQADRARRVVELAGRRPPTFTSFEEVALVDLMSRDLAAARAFVEAQLGPLAAGDDTTARIRAALLAVTEPGGGLAAAARRLGVHRNTILQRVHKAEELLGRPVTDGAAELHAALLLAESVPGAVLEAS